MSIIILWLEEMESAGTTTKAAWETHQCPLKYQNIKYVPASDRVEAKKQSPHYLPYYMYTIKKNIQLKQPLIRKTFMRISPILI